MSTTRIGKSRERHEGHWVEWLTGLVSALFVLAMLGWIGREAWRQTGEPPDLSIAITDNAVMKNGLYRVEFDIANASTSTAAAVTVAGELRDGQSVIERSEVTFDYVPAESSAHGAILFRADPSTHAMTLSVMGYTEP